MREIIEHMNKIHDTKTDDTTPSNIINKILNRHQRSLAWLDQTTRGLVHKSSEVSSKLNNTIKTQN